MRPRVYIVTNHKHGTLYIGVTSSLPHRIWQHRTGSIEGFSQRHGLKMLVWYQEFGTMEDAIVREKQMKAWKRAWKIRLIEEMNPGWKDLYEELNR